MDIKFHIYNEVAQASSSLRLRFPTVEVFDVTTGFPDPCADVGAVRRVLFGLGGQLTQKIIAHGIDWVQLLGTGVDAVSPEVFMAPIVTCSRGASAVPISQYVFAAIRAYEKACARDAFDDGSVDNVKLLAGKTLGLLGLGGIGQQVAKAALAFGMQVVAMRRHTELGSPVLGVDVVSSIDALVAHADHIVLAAPLTSCTHSLFNAQVFAAMKRGVHIINVARGALIDQDALRVALDSGVVARASLDTVTPEPLPAGHWLYTHPLVFLTPHVAWLSDNLFGVALDMFCDNFQRFVDGQPLLHTVNLADGY